MKIVITILLLLVLTVNVGCSNIGELVTQHGSAFVEVVDGMEQSGADYGAECYIPGYADMNWSPFGFNAGIPGSYVRVWVNTGRGSGPRPVDRESGPPFDNLPKKEENETNTDNSVTLFDSDDPFVCVESSFG